MSTKNLSRTVIEGGQHSSSSFERKHINRSSRHATKSILKDFVNHSADDPESLMIEESPVHYHLFTDKLGPMYKFLRSKIGQPWSQVYSEIKKKFDDRTTAARHIIHDHMLPIVNDTSSGMDSRGRMINPEKGEIHSTLSLKNNRRFPNFYVDGDGHLQDVTVHINPDKVSLEDKKEIVKFLDNRVVAKIGDKLHWCFPKNGFWKIEVSTKKSHKSAYEFNQPYYNRQEICLMKEEHGEYKEKVVVMSDKKTWWGGPEFDLLDRARSGYHWADKEVAEGFVPRAPLNDKEMEQFNNFNSKCQELILSFGRGISN